MNKMYFSIIFNIKVNNFRFIDIIFLFIKFIIQNLFNSYLKNINL